MRHGHVKEAVEAGFPEPVAGSSAVSGYLYDATGQDRFVSVEPGLAERLHDQVLLWIDVVGRASSNVEQVADILKLGPSSLRDLLKLEPRVGGAVDNYGTYIQFSVLLPAGVTPPAPEPGDGNTAAATRRVRPRLDFVVGENWLLTVHDEEVPFLDAFRSQDKADTAIGTLSAHALAASLLDWHLESFFKEVARVELAVDRLDERILAEPNSERLLESVLAIRRRISRLRRLLRSQRPVFYGISRPDVLPSPDASTARLFESLASRYERAVDEVEHTRDLVVGSFELFTSRSSQQTNELVKALTFFTVIVGSAAAIAGLFGMNFDPPFFQTGSRGFLSVTSGLLVLGLAAWIVGRRRKWI